VSQCTFCDSLDAHTVDHVPPKSFFRGRGVTGLVTVRACAACNSGASADDEYVRDTVLKHHEVGEQPAATPQVASMLRGMANPKKQKYAEATMRSIGDVQVTTPAGLYLGTRPAFVIDGSRLKRTFERYIRGLYRHEFGSRVPIEAEFNIAVDPERVLAEQTAIEATFRGGTTRVVDPEVFFYSFVRDEKQHHNSGWLLVFFNTFAVVGAIRMPQPSVGAS
jgi:hypothetical protein